MAWADASEARIQRGKQVSRSLSDVTEPKIGPTLGMPPSSALTNVRGEDCGLCLGEKKLKSV